MRTLRADNLRHTDGSDAIGQASNDGLRGFGEGCEGFWGICIWCARWPGFRESAVRMAGTRVEDRIFRLRVVTFGAKDASTLMNPIS